MINGRDLEMGEHLGLLWIIPEAQFNHMDPKSREPTQLWSERDVTVEKSQRDSIVLAVKMEEGPNAREFGSLQKLEKARNEFSSGASRRNGLTDTP